MNAFGFKVNLCKWIWIQLNHNYSLYCKYFNQNNIQNTVRYSYHLTALVMFLSSVAFGFWLVSSFSLLSKNLNSSFLCRTQKYAKQIKCNEYKAHLNRSPFSLLPDKKSTSEVFISPNTVYPEKLQIGV